MEQNCLLDVWLLILIFFLTFDSSFGNLFDCQWHLSSSHVNEENFPLIFCLTTSDSRQIDGVSLTCINDTRHSTFFATRQVTFDSRQLRTLVCRQNGRISIKCTLSTLKIKIDFVISLLFARVRVQRFDACLTLHFATPFEFTLTPFFHHRFDGIVATPTTQDVASVHVCAGTITGPSLSA